MSESLDGFAMLRRFCCLTTALILIGPAAPQNVPQPARMTTDAHPSFAVAAIKLHDPAAHNQGFMAHGDRFTIRDQTVAGLLLYAYSIHPRQIIDAPDWALHESYDIEGKTDIEGEPNLRQQQEMIQKLLADRFQLRFHRDRRDLAVYAICIGKTGPKLGPAAKPDAQPSQHGSVKGNELTQTYTSASIADFLLSMQFFLDRPLIDQTGLTGRYDFKLRYAWDELRVSDAEPEPSIFTAMQEQLGLKLEPIKAPCDVLVIDAVERPSAN